MVRRSKYRELEADRLRRVCDYTSFSFDTTEELPMLKGLFNQSRVLQGLALGIRSADKFLHVKVIQSSGTSRKSALKKVIEGIASNHFDGSSVKDFCYVHNFEDSSSPSLLTFSRGRGSMFSDRMDAIASEIIKEFPVKFVIARMATFASMGQVIGTEIAIRFTGIINQDVPEVGIRFLLDFSGPIEDKFIMGFTIKATDKDKKFPVQEEGYDPKEFSPEENLSKWLNKYVEEEEIRETILASFFSASAMHNRVISLFEEQLSLRLGEWSDSYIADFYDKTVGDMQNDFPEASFYLTELREFFLENYGDIATQEKQNYSLFFEVNLVVDNSLLEDGRVPVIWEDDPTFRNLFGTIDRVVSSRMTNGNVGVEQSNHMNLKAGSLIFANGGVVIIPMWKFIKKRDFEETWEAFATALLNEEVTIEDLSARMGTLTLDELRPEAIPLNVRVVLITDSHLDHVFSSNPVYSKDYSLFGVKAQFLPDAPRNKRNERKLAQFLATCSQKEGILHCDREAVALFVEYASRLAESQKRLTLDFAKIKHTLLEANYWAKRRSSRRNASCIMARDVQNAIKQEHYRSNALEERIQEMIQEGSLKINLRGRKVGHINAISVLSIGDTSFGRPLPLTASTSLGSGNIVNVDRVANMAGNIQQKSVLEIEGYIKETFGRAKRLSMRSQLVFEQNYSGIDGDSAAAAELYVLFSSLAQIPIDQGVGITGSCNQLGEIQAIGEVNAKIEGFFDICKLLGRGRLSDKQGVIIPHDNRHDLMLREDVVEAVRAGKFHIWTIRHIDEGIELLFDISSEQMHERINESLEELREATKPKKQEEKQDEENKKSSNNPT